MLMRWMRSVGIRIYNPFCNSLNLENFNDLRKRLNALFSHNHGNNNSSKFCNTVIYWFKVFSKFASNNAGFRNKSPKAVNV